MRRECAPTPCLPLPASLTGNVSCPATASPPTRLSPVRAFHRLLCLWETRHFVPCSLARRQVSVLLRWFFLCAGPVLCRRSLTATHSLRACSALAPAHHATRGDDRAVCPPPELDVDSCIGMLARQCEAVRPGQARRYRPYAGVGSCSMRRADIDAVGRRFEDRQ